jgi:osmoprotectant transport system substrate-binding protein
MRHPAKILATALAGLLVCASANAATVVVGGKDFTEQLLLAEMTAQLLEAKGFDVDKRDGMGSQIVRDAQVNGQVDVYWEYTGTSLVTYNKVTERLDAEQTYSKVKSSTPRSVSPGSIRPRQTTPTPSPSAAKTRRPTR